MTTQSATEVSVESGIALESPAVAAAPDSAVRPEVHSAVLPAARPQGPSIHMRALITWMAIFPLVSVGMLLLGPVMEPLHPVLRALLLTVLVVPAAVYVVVPRLMAGHGALSRKAVERAAQRAARTSA